MEGRRASVPKSRSSQELASDSDVQLWLNRNTVSHRPKARCRLEFRGVPGTGSFEDSVRDYDCLLSCRFSTRFSWAWVSVGFRRRPAAKVGGEQSLSRAPLGAKRQKGIVADWLLPALVAIREEFLEADIRDTWLLSARPGNPVVLRANRGRATQCPMGRERSGTRRASSFVARSYSRGNSKGATVRSSSRCRRRSRRSPCVCDTAVPHAADWRRKPQPPGCLGAWRGTARWPSPGARRSDRASRYPAE